MGRHVIRCEKCDSIIDPGGFCAAHPPPAPQVPTKELPAVTELEAALAAHASAPDPVATDFSTAPTPPPAASRPKHIRAVPPVDSKKPKK